MTLIVIHISIGELHRVNYKTCELSLKNTHPDCSWFGIENSRFPLLFHISAPLYGRRLLVVYREIEFVHLASLFVSSNKREVKYFLWQKDVNQCCQCTLLPCRTKLNADWFRVRKARSKPYKRQENINRKNPIIIVGLPFL